MRSKKIALIIAGSMIFVTACSNGTKETTQAKATTTVSQAKEKTASVASNAKNSVAGAVSKATDKASSVASNAKNASSQASNALSQAKEKTSSVASNAKNSVVGAASKANDKASSVASNAKNASSQASNTLSQAKEKTSSVASNAKNGANSILNNPAITKLAYADVANKLYKFKDLNFGDVKGLGAYSLKDVVILASEDGTKSISIDKYTEKLDAVNKDTLNKVFDELFRGIDIKNKVDVPNVKVFGNDAKVITGELTSKGKEIFTKVYLVQKGNEVYSLISRANTLEDAQNIVDELVKVLK